MNGYVTDVERNTLESEEYYGPPEHPDGTVQHTRADESE